MEYKPNIYPIMYWALLYGVIAAVALLLFKMLVEYLTFIWFPVFLAGMIWGGYRKYMQDKKAWMEGKGIVGTSKSAIEEFKDAARDIAQASQEMIAKNAKEDAEAAMAQQQAQEEPLDESVPQETPAEESAPEPLMETQAPSEPEYPAEHEEIVTQEPAPEPDEPRAPQSPTQPLV